MSLSYLSDDEMQMGKPEKRNGLQVTAAYSSVSPVEARESEVENLPLRGAMSEKRICFAVGTWIKNAAKRRHFEL